MESLTMAEGSPLTSPFAKRFLELKSLTRARLDTALWVCCCFISRVLSPAWDSVSGCCRGSGKASKTPALHPRVAQDLLQLRPVRGVLGQAPADQMLALWGEKADSAGHWQKAPAQPSPAPAGPGPRCLCSGLRRPPERLCPAGRERHGGTRPPPLAARATLTPWARATSRGRPWGQINVVCSCVRAAACQSRLLGAGDQPGETCRQKKSCSSTMAWSSLKGRLPQTMTYSSTPRDQTVAAWPW